MAQGAAAAGQTAFTCAKGGGALDFTHQHCIASSKVPAGTGTYGHVAFIGATKFTVSGGLIKLKSTQSGVTLEIQATELTGSGELENKEEGGEMFARGTGAVTSKMRRSRRPRGLAAKIKGSEIVTKELAASTKGLTNEVKYTPAAAETSAFAEFTIEGCSIAALNHTYTAKGSFKGQTDGATTKFTHANTTAQETLTLQGQVAGLEGETTTKGPNGNGFSLA